LTAVVDAVRYNPVALTMFGAGLIVLAVTGAALARVLWTSGIRIGAVLGFGVLYLPQSFRPPWVRIAHGLILGVGLVLVAFQMPRKTAG